MINELIKEQNTLNDAFSEQNKKPIQESKPQLIHLKHAIMQQVLMDMQYGGSIRTTSVVKTLSTYYHSKPK